MRSIGKKAGALVMIAAAMASGTPVVAPSANGNTVVPSQQQNDKQQTPAPTPAAQMRNLFLGGGFTAPRSRACTGCPWPGRAAARARHTGKGRRPR